MVYFGMITDTLLRIKDFDSFIHYEDIYSVTSRRQLLVAPDPSTAKTRNFLGEDKQSGSATYMYICFIVGVYVAFAIKIMAIVLIPKTTRSRGARANV